MAEAAASSSPEDEDETGELVEDGAEAESQSPSSHSSPPATTLNIYNPIQENVDKSHSQLQIKLQVIHEAAAQRRRSNNGCLLRLCATAFDSGDW